MRYWMLFRNQQQWQTEPILSLQNTTPMRFFFLFLIISIGKVESQQPVWTELTYPFSINGPSAVYDFLTVGNSLYLAGCEGPIAKTTDEAVNWTLPFTSSGFCFDGFVLKDSFIFAYSSPLGSGLETNRISRLSTKDNALKILYNVGVTVHSIQCLTVHKGYLLASTSSNALGGVIYRSIDNGESWTAVNTPPNLRPFQIISNDGRIIAIGDSYTAYSDNDGQIWTIKGASIIDPSKIIALSSKDLVLGTKGGGMLFSYDNGAAWSGQTGIIGSGYIQDLLQADGNLFVATGDKGVAKNGVPFNDGLTNLRVTSLGVHKGKIYAGTIDKKLWRLENFTVSTAEASSLNPNPDLFPNPVHLGDLAHLRFEASSDVSFVKLTNSVGTYSTHLSVRDDGISTISTAGLTPGIYSLTYGSGTLLFSKRLLVLE